MIKLQMLDYEGRGKFAHVTDGKHIIYVQYNGDFNGYSITSVHKPSKIVGTGYRLLEHLGQREVERNLIAHLATFCPEWATTQDREATIKYSTPEEFLNYSKRFMKDSHWIDFNINLIK